MMLLIRCLRIVLILLVLPAISFAGQFKATRVTDGDTIKVYGTQAIIDNGTADSLNKAIDGLDQLRKMIIGDQVTVALDEACSVDLVFSKGAVK